MKPLFMFTDDGVKVIVTLITYLDVGDEQEFVGLLGANGNTTGITKNGKGDRLERGCHLCILDKR